MDTWTCSVFAFLYLTLIFRAVEVFIRDKYERKKYFDKEALTTAPVSIANTTCFYGQSFGLSVPIIVTVVYRTAVAGCHFLNLCINGCLLHAKQFDASICEQQKPT
ncbi:hypothetical protein F2P81_025937 [Scophthalmus maximus]|uniref:Uncharacterized protein n=1 Tax=Scophthalmus maximus TaxID=52904 RepID=A0A6A4RR06_SCOMX|nr:hypothetical protein F2P81_025937 [Scophthalmus maximus]